MRASDFEIRNYSKLDRILSKLCELVERGQQSEQDYGMVAACVVDPNNRVVARLNYPGKDGMRVHAERAAMEAYNKQHGSIPNGSIVITTCSPCNEDGTDMADHRYGSSCTDYINSSPVKKVYCGYIDPSQDDDSRQFNLLETSDADIRQQCKEFADTFLDHHEKEGVLESLDYAEKMSGLVDLPVFGTTGTAKVVNTGDRIMAVMNIKGVNVPYYISTGDGGKASVPTGKWYPVFGVHSSGWLNKGGEASINNFYGSRLLRLNAGRLNNALGDLRSVEDKIPFMKKPGREVINKDLQPMGHSEVSANPNEFKNRVNSFLAKLGEAPFYTLDKPAVGENFADGRNPQDKGDSKRHGINTKASVSSLRKTAKQGGRKGQLSHWLANMKAGRAKNK